jgi:peptide/nickel transport system substrate-binding protein
LGQAKRQCSIYPETSWVYNPDVPCYDYDPEMAVAKFEEAGYTYQDDVMLDADGNPLTLKLVYGPNTNKIRELMAVTVQDYLSDIGVTVEIQAMEWASYLETVTGEGTPEWDMYILGWNSTIEPHIMYTIWSQENIPSLNATGYINEEVEALFKEGGMTYDNEIRKEKYQEIQRIIAEDSPYIFLFYSKARSGQNIRIQGIEPRALGIGWNSEDWYIMEP